METRVFNEIHVLDDLLRFVELPLPWHAMQQVVDAPLEGVAAFLVRDGCVLEEDT